MRVFSLLFVVALALPLSASTQKLEPESPELGKTLSTSSSRAIEDITLVEQPPVVNYGSLYERQEYVECCAVTDDDDDGTIFDEFDDEILWHYNQVHVGDDWIDADGRDILDLIFGCKTSPCVIKDSMGGGLMEFALAAKAAEYTNTRIVIKGECRSACALFADIARSLVCLGPDAKLGFHQWVKVKMETKEENGERYYRSVPVTYYDPVQSDDVLDLVRANGGFPRTGVNVLPLSAALTIWRACPSGH